MCKGVSHSVVIMGHLQPRPFEAALHIETLISLRAVQDGLVASDILGDVIQCLDDAQPKLFALLIFGDRNVLNMPNETKVVDAAILLSMD